MAPTDSSLRNAPTAPPRIPKLAVRNRTQPDQISLATTSSAEAAHCDVDSITSAPKAFEDPPPLTPSFSVSTRPSSSIPTGSSSSNLAQHGFPGNLPKVQKKKKGNSVLGFLALKEPSQSALEQFAEQQRKQAAEKGVTKNATGLPGISPQKLPPTVPRVNSKWDGVPEAVKAKDAASRKRDSTLTVEKFWARPSSSTGSVTTSTSLGSQNPPNSLASSVKSVSFAPPSPSVNSFASSQGSPMQPRFSNPPGFDPAAAGLITRTSIKSPSMSSLPEISYFFPDDSQARVQETSSPPSKTQPMTPSDIQGASSNAKEAIRASVSESIASPDESLIVDWARSPTLIEFPTDAESGDTQTMLKRLSKNPHGFLAGEAQEIRLPEEDEEPKQEGDSEEALTPVPEPQTVAVAILPEESVADEESDKIEGITIVPSSPGEKKMMPSQPVTNFSRPLSYQAPLTALTSNRFSTDNATIARSSPEAPTMVEPSISDDTILYDSLPRHTRNISTAHSMASSVAPSEMSAQWFRSPRERLGLGGRIKKTDILPWEIQDHPKRKMGRLSLFVKGSE